MNIVEENRLGKIEIDQHFIKDRTDEVLSVLNGLLIVHAEMRYESRSIHYTGYHKDFDKLEFGTYTPWYDVVMQDHSFLRMEKR